MHIADKGLVGIVQNDCLKLKREREREIAQWKNRQRSSFAGSGGGGIRVGRRKDE